jgi:hypothetical protein
MILCGVTFAAIPWYFNVTDLLAKSATQLPPMPAGWTAEQAFRMIYTGFGGCSSIFGLLLLILCFFVRRGGTASAVTSLVLEGLLVLLLGINVISGVVEAISQPAVLIGVVFLAVPIALLGINMFWLVGAARNAGQIAYARSQYQSQYYLYQQQHQMYAQPPGAAPYPPGYPPSAYNQTPAAQPPTQPAPPPESGGPNEPPTSGQ